MIWSATCWAFAAMRDGRQALGRIGEDLACGELTRRGYAILARRYRRAGGEVDIVARDGAAIVFVEVKAREGPEFGEGAEAVTGLKQRRIVRAALDYLVRHGHTGAPCRFDVVSIQLGAGEPRIDVYRSAFDAAF